MKPTITFPAGTNYVRIGDIHKLLLEASGDPFVVLAYEDELKGAIRDGEITPLNSLTHRRHTFPRGAALNLADITVEEFGRFAVDFQINVAIEEAAPNMPEKVGNGETANEAKKPRTNKKVWTDDMLRTLWNESIQPGVTHDSLGNKHKVSRQRIGKLLKKAKTKFSVSGKPKSLIPAVGRPITFQK